MTAQTTIIIQSPPLSQIAGKEGVDLALVCAAFEHSVKLVFIDQGIFHLLKSQDQDQFGDKLHDKQLKALSFYDIESVHYELDSLQKYQLQPRQLIDSVNAINRETVNQISQQTDHLLIF